jgi:hypothetical protein
VREARSSSPGVLEALLVEAEVEAFDADRSLSWMAERES